MSDVDKLLGKIDHLEQFADPDVSKLIHKLTWHDLRKIRDQQSYKKCVARVNDLCKSLKDQFIDKDHLIDLMAWATVAQLPMLLLGPWGTGKSYLIRSFARRMGLLDEGSRKHVDKEDEELELLKGSQQPTTRKEGSRYFEYLVTRFTTPEELLGPVNVDLLLSRSVYYRQTRGLLPRAEIAFLDEVFKANSAILNALLSLINERLFYNVGQAWKVNLMMLFAASNEPPQEEELQAFYDRFPVRALCNPVQDDRVPALLARAHALHCAAVEPPAESENRDKPLACANDFRLLGRMSLYLFGGTEVDGKGDGEFYQAYLKIFRHLRDEHDISDRSCDYYYRLARARALLEKREHLDKKDCMVLSYSAKDMNLARHLPGVVESLIC
jgi:MoxR-like ATPase